MRACEPEEIYNLAAMSFVGASWNQPTLTAEFTGVGVTRMLEAMREACPEARFYQASSSEMFGKVRETPQNELTPVLPAQPLRRRQGLRPLHHRQLPRELRPLRLLGDPLQPREPAPQPRVRHPQDHPRRRRDQARPGQGADARQHSTPAATGATRRTSSTRCGGCCSRTSPTTSSSAPAIDHSVQDLVDIAFAHVGLDPAEYVRQDPRFMRPAEVDLLIADPTKARERARLGAERRLRAAGQADGRRRPRPARTRATPSRPPSGAPPAQRCRPARWRPRRTRRPRCGPRPSRRCRRGEDVALGVAGERAEREHRLREQRVLVRGVDPEGLQRRRRVRVDGLGDQQPAGAQPRAAELEEALQLGRPQVLHHLGAEDRPQGALGGVRSRSPAGRPARRSRAPSRGSAAPSRRRGRRRDRRSVLRQQVEDLAAAAAGVEHRLVARRPAPDRRAGGRGSSPQARGRGPRSRGSRRRGRLPERGSRSSCPAPGGACRRGGRRPCRARPRRRRPARWPAPSGRPARAGSCRGPSRSSRFPPAPRASRRPIRRC